MAKSEEERSTADRRNQDRGALRLGLGPVRDLGFGEVYTLVPIQPKERLVGDEIEITPSKNWRRQQDRAQARQILKKADKGEKVPDRTIEKLQQRLQSGARQEALRGRESDGQQLSEELGEVRRSNLVKEANRVLEQAQRGKGPPDRNIEKLQQRLMGMEQQDQRLGRESDGLRLAMALGEIRRSRLLKDAQDIVARGSKGQQFKETDLFKLQQTLGNMGRQDEMLGQDNEERALIRSLGELRRSQLVAEAKQVLARGGKGKRVSKDDIAKLQQRLLGFERQNQLSGEESEEAQLANSLAELRK